MDNELFQFETICWVIKQFVGSFHQCNFHKIFKIICLFIYYLYFQFLRWQNPRESPMAEVFVTDLVVRIFKDDFRVS